MVRSLVVALAAVVALLVPSAAHAGLYPPPDADLEVSDPTPPVGEPFIVEIEGEVGAEATLQIVSADPGTPDSAIEIAGARALTKTVPNTGVASFTVTLNAPGTYTLTALVDGVVVDTQTVTAQAVGADGDVLSETGVSALPLLLSAAGLVLVGSVGVVLARRRQREGVRG